LINLNGDDGLLARVIIWKQGSYAKTSPIVKGFRILDVIQMVYKSLQPTTKNHAFDDG
jgi:hypothetical protein